MRELSYQETKRIAEIAEKFDIKKGKIEWIIPIDSGRINYTYKVVVNIGDDTFSYLLQQINVGVFKKPYDIMENALAITKHIRSKEGKTLVFVRLRCHKDSGAKEYIYEESIASESKIKTNYWRMTEFIHSEVFQSVTKKEDMYTLGMVVCNFCKSLDDFDAKSLHEIIPNFHNTRKRFETLLISVTEDFMEGKNRASNLRAKEAIKFIIERKNKLSTLVSMLEQGKIPYRVTHNDPKLNNILFDRKTNNPICLIDLDTVMPGSILYDIGDAIRSGANTISEESTNYKNATLDMELYKEFVKACIDSKLLSKKEIELIPLSVWTITLELGIRFLTDYINGNIYFHSEFEEQNLNRSWIQFSLVKDIELKTEEMKQFIEEYMAKK